MIAESHWYYPFKSNIMLSFATIMLYLRLYGPIVLRAGPSLEGKAINKAGRTVATSCGLGPDACRLGWAWTCFISFHCFWTLGELFAKTT